MGERSSGLQAILLRVLEAYPDSITLHPITRGRRSNARHACQIIADVPTEVVHAFRRSLRASGENDADVFLAVRITRAAVEAVLRAEKAER